jgi:signal transduction histidine kinase
MDTRQVSDDAAAASSARREHPVRRQLSTPGHADDVPSDQRLRARQRWAGRLAAFFFISSGVLGVLTLPALPRGASLVGSALISTLAIAIGLAAWFVPWDRLRRSASLVLLPPAFALIGVGNMYGGTEYFTYAVFFVVAFVWIGLAHPPWTSLLVAPLALVAYLLPLAELPHDDAVAGIESATMVLPLCVLIAEALARGIDRATRTEDELRRERETAERLRALDAMRESFLHSASHELRTPLTVCRGHLEVSGMEGTDVRGAIAIVIDELDRMDRLVEDITALTRLEDPSALVREPMDVGDLLSAVAAKAVPLLGGRLGVGPTTTGSAIVDRQRMTQALLNLLENAATHAGPAARVELRVTRDGEAWRFVVADDGIGLSEDDVPELFEPFRHGTASRGTGLGLAIVRAIARAHGGDVGASPRQGGGAVFWMEIPA